MNASSAKGSSSTGNAGAPWWLWALAGLRVAAHYHLPLSNDPDTRNQAVWLLNPSPGTLSRLPPPEIIIASKPDLFDDQGVLVEYVRKTPYARSAGYPAFMLWQRKADGLEQRNGPQTGNLIE